MTEEMVYDRLNQASERLGKTHLILSKGNPIQITTESNQEDWLYHETTSFKQLEEWVRSNEDALNQLFLGDALYAIISSNESISSSSHPFKMTNKGRDVWIDIDD